MKKLFRFLYLNTYGLLLICAGLVAVGIPFWKISIWSLVIQLPLSVFFIWQGAGLLSRWNDKKREYQVLMKKNVKEFNSESFKIFMQAPCGRKLTRAVLKDLNCSEKYKDLLVFKPKFTEVLYSLCAEKEKPVVVRSLFISEKL